MPDPYVPSTDQVTTQHTASKHTCSKCNQRHHTALHDEQRTQRTPKFNPNQGPNQVNHLASQKKISKVNSSLLLLLPVTLRHRNIYLNVYLNIPFLIQEEQTATYRNRQQHIFNWRKPTIRNNFSLEVSTTRKR